DAVEGDIAQRIGTEGQAAVAREAGDLEIEILCRLEIGDDAVMVDLALAFVERCGIEVRAAVDGKTRRLSRRVGDLELALKCTEHGTDAARRIDDSGEIRETVTLLRVVVKRRLSRRRRFDADAV